MSREITEAQRHWLAGEIDAWKGLGLLTGEQARDVLDLYATAEQFGKLRQSRTLTTMLALSALLVGLGVFLLVAYNWQELPAALKVAMILAGLVATHSGGLALRSRSGLAGASRAAFLLGCLIYGAGIWLIAQIFHLSGHDPDAVWWWALGVLPFALALDALELHALYALLLAVWVGWEVLGFAVLGAWLFGRWPALPNGAYGLLVMAAPGFAWAYRKGSDKALALYVPLVAWWVILQPFAWRFETTPVYFMGAVGGLLLLAAEAHRPGSKMAIPYRVYGGLLTAGVLVPLSFYGFHKEIGPGPLDAWSPGLVQTLAIAGLSGATLAAVVVVRRLRRPETEHGPFAADLADLARRQWLPFGIVTGMAAMAAWAAFSGGEWPLPQTIGANVAMIALAFWLMRAGVHDDRGSAFGAGVVYFVFWAVLRYIDLFSDFGGMLGAALMFFLCGAILFGMAIYWRRRKEVDLA
jgi:uncharacterized membrane protein